jgi:hypothetical protein
LLRSDVEVWWVVGNDTASEWFPIDVWDAQHIGDTWTGFAWLTEAYNQVASDPRDAEGWKIIVQRTDGDDYWDLIHIGPRQKRPGIYSERDFGDEPPDGLLYEEAMMLFDSLPY